MPAIALTDSEKPGILKGSARSTDDINMKKVLDAVAEYIIAYGGHAGAAGLTVSIDMLDSLRKAAQKVTPKSKHSGNYSSYDVEISVDEISDTYKEIRQFAPYGEGFPQPVVKVKDFTLAKKFDKYYRYIMSKGIYKGISWNGTNCEAVSFGKDLRDKYVHIGTPLKMNLIGTIGWNDYQGAPQIMVSDIQEIVSSQKQSGFLI